MRTFISTVSVAAGLLAISCSSIAQNLIQKTDLLSVYAQGDRMRHFEPYLRFSLGSFTTGFEGEPPGLPPSAFDIQGPVTVSRNESHEGSQSVRLARVNPNEFVVLRKRGTRTFSGTMLASIRVPRNVVVDTYVDLYNGHTRLVDVLLRPDGTVVYRTSTNKKIPVGTYVRNAWNDIEISWVEMAVTNRFSLKVNGVDLGIFPTETKGLDPSEFLVKYGSQSSAVGGPSLYVDSVVWYTQPGYDFLNSPPTDRLYLQRLSLPRKILDANKDGKLIRKAQKNGEKIMDFSMAGYGGGGVPIPKVPTVLTAEPIAGDNTAMLQAKIHELEAMPVQKNGYRGALLLKRGIYNISKTLVISKSGVVVKGEGSLTTIHVNTTSQIDAIRAQGSGKRTEGQKVSVGATGVFAGSSSIPLDYPGYFQPGDDIVVAFTPNWDWINELNMSQYGWTPENHIVKYERKVKSVTDKHIVLDAPIPQTITHNHGGGYVAKFQFPGRIKNIGIHNLTLKSSYNPYVENYFWPWGEYDYNNGNKIYYKSDEAHAKNAIKLSKVENAFVSKIVAYHFIYATVTVENFSKFVTVQDAKSLEPVSLIDGRRRYSFNVNSDSQFVLMQRLYSQWGRHSFVTGKGIPGPVVFLDGEAVTPYNEDGPHHRWATGILWDNISTHVLNIWDRAEKGTGHGWAGSQNVVWNSTARAKSGLVCQRPQTSQNYAIGITANNVTGSSPNPGDSSHPVCHRENVNTFPGVRSLYLKQLEDRLGFEAVKKVTTAEQRMEGKNRNY